MVKVRCKYQGCKSELTNPDNIYCSRHKYEKGDDDVFSDTNI